MLKYMDILPERQKEALSLFELADFPIEEIRKIQGGTASGVKMRLVRARAKLAILMRDGETEFKKEYGAVTTEVNS